MDEADILGDRIAMIANGRLIAYASSDYLKNKFGRGYYLTLSKKESNHEIRDRIIYPNHTVNEESLNSNDGNLEDVDVEDEFYKIEKNIFETTLVNRKINDFVKSRLKNAILVKNSNSEMVYSISKQPKDTIKYGKFFSELENASKAFKIESIGLSDTTLEEVFIRLAKEPKKSINYYKSNWLCSLSCFQLIFWKTLFLKIPFFRSKEVTIDLAHEDLFQYTKKRVDSKLMLLTQQFRALLIKRFHRLKRYYRGLIAEFLLPLLFICLAILAISLLPNVDHWPALEINPWLTSETNDYPNYIFYSKYFNEKQDLNNLKIIEDVTNTFYDKPSIGTRCMSNHYIISPNTKQKLPCDKFGYTIAQNESVPQNIKDALSAVNYSYSNIAPSCSCSNGFPNCPIGSDGDVDYRNVSHLITTDTLVDLTQRNISDWLLNTEFSKEYFQKRYGGFDFSNNMYEPDITVEASNIYTILTGGTKSYSESQKAKIWFNNKGYFSAVSYLNTLNNAILRSKLKKINTNLEKVGIIAINHPLPFTPQQKSQQLKNNQFSNNQAFVAVCILFAFSFMPASFLISIVDERVSNSKQLQFVSGIKPYIYWFANFLWDIINFIIPALLCITLFFIFNIDIFTAKENVPAIITLFLVYGWASKKVCKYMFDIFLKQFFSF